MALRKIAETIRCAALLGSLVAAPTLTSASIVYAQDSAEESSVRQAHIEQTEKAKIAVSTVTSGLERPWGLAFLPDGSFLVTERPGRLRHVSRGGAVSAPFRGVPTVAASGQGGLLDIALDPAFPENRTAYIAFVEPRDSGSGIVVIRAVIDLDRLALTDVETIFSQKDSGRGNANFGVRLVPDDEGFLFITVGDRFSTRDKAQDLDSHLGKVLRINTDGTVPIDNPFVGQDNALPEIWSVGHRNAQGAALNPKTGELWISEHGARGGDEINIVRKGLNYGWPIITHGVDYSGAPIGIGNARDGLEQPIYYWVPSIAPSGLAFHDGGQIEPWRDSVFVGALAGQALVRLEVADEAVTHEERILTGLNERIRDVRTGPDGYLYLLTDSENGRILRIGPSR
ncbi:PQQ-dependent sugar dehydrogenase [Pseudochelatococcus contaminans]|uniref:Glucose/arabinose dehydrogenase n=1 Tax=Pseudochelatococcus contaminans TaxID=1538103 RepID=A0A7W5Z423_9HYPH|nr:PQQ-dependent sugar dehydrogenase [Pseudochelatococcus contaminans]MBB3809768.1 glucose/arabinose dehydrogenase [Pseudochelatococcus contaminans]